MRYASVCSGVEAATLAWWKLGWTPVFFAEVEPFPCAVLQQRFNATKPLHPLDPAEAVDEKDRKMRESWKKQIDKLPEGGTIPNLGDFTKIKGEDYVGAIDLLVGGTPCQDLSVAGKRAGFEGARSSLALDFVRLAYEAGCQYFVLENVPGIFSSNRGRDFATLLSMFCGYTVDVPKDGWKSSGIVQNRRPDRYGIAWRVLDAQFTRVSGFPFAVPQRRRRVFVVGCLGDWERAASILLEPDRLSWDTPPRIKTRQEVTGSIGTGSDCAGTLKARPSASPFPERGQTVVCETGNGFYREGESAGTLEQHEDQHRRNVVCFHGSQDTITNESHANAIGRNGGLENCVCYDARGNGDGETVNTITGDHNNRVTDYTPLVQNAVACAEKFWNGEDVASTITQRVDQNRMPDKDQFHGVLNGQTVRRLLPIEAERLMGFPDNHTRISWNGKPEDECPDAPRYKACGNSMCVNCMEWIGRRIEEFAK